MNTKERVLILDDEEMIVDIYAEFLEQEFSVVKNCTPLDAIKDLEANGHGISAILIDYNMPGMNGIEFLQYMRDHNLKIPVVICTGAAPDSIYDWNVPVVKKPATGIEILKSIREVLQKKEEKELCREKSALTYANSIIQDLERVLLAKGCRPKNYASPVEAISQIASPEIFSLWLSWHRAGKIKEILDRAS